MADNDLISRSALLDDLRGCYDDLIRVYDSLRYVPEKQICGAQLSELKNIVYWVNNAPAVDAVEVVRCRDCKHFYDTHINPAYSCKRGGAQVWDVSFTPDDFCSYGERKQGDADG